MPLPDHRRRLDDAVAWPPGRCRRPAQPRRSERCHWPPPPARPTAAAAVAVDVPGVSTGGGPGGPCPPSPPTSLAALSRPQHRGCCVSGRRRCRPPLHPCNPPRLSVPASQTTLATGFSDVHLPRLAPLMKPRPPRQATVAAASCNPPPPPQTALAPSRKPPAVGVALAPSPSNRPAGPCTPPRHLAPAVGAQPRRGAGHACRHLLRPTHRQPQYNPWFPPDVAADSAVRRARAPAEATDTPRLWCDGDAATAQARAERAGQKKMEGSAKGGDGRGTNTPERRRRRRSHRRRHPRSRSPVPPTARPTFPLTRHVRRSPSTPRSPPHSPSPLSRPSPRRRTRSLRRWWWRLRRQRGRRRPPPRSGAARCVPSGPPPAAPSTHRAGSDSHSRRGGGCGGRRAEWSRRSPSSLPDPPSSAARSGVGGQEGISKKPPPVGRRERGHLHHREGGGGSWRVEVRERAAKTRQGDGRGDRVARDKGGKGRVVRGVEKRDRLATVAPTAGAPGEGVAPAAGERRATPQEPPRRARQPARLAVVRAARGSATTGGPAGGRKKS